MGWADSWNYPGTLPPVLLLDTGWWVFGAQDADNQKPGSLGLLVASPDPENPNIEHYITMSIHFVVAAAPGGSREAGHDQAT
jgi:hypothetical protein